MRNEPLCPTLAPHMPPITQPVIRRSQTYQRLTSAAGGFQTRLLSLHFFWCISCMFMCWPTNANGFVFTVNRIPTSYSTIIYKSPVLSGKNTPLKINSICMSLCVSVSWVQPSYSQASHGTARWQAGGKCQAHPVDPNSHDASPGRHGHGWLQLCRQPACQLPAESWSLCAEDCHHNW